MFRVILCMSPLEKVPFATFTPVGSTCVAHIFQKKDFFKWTHVFNFIGWCNLFFSTLFKGIIRKECQSFTNHGHAKTPPTVFNPLSLWLTLPRDMGVSHTLWPPRITRATLACLWFAQYDVQVILCIQFYRLMQLIFSTLLYMFFILSLNFTGILRNITLCNFT